MKGPGAPAGPAALPASRKDRSASLGRAALSGVCHSTRQSRQLGAARPPRCAGAGLCCGCGARVLPCVARRRARCTGAGSRRRWRALRTGWLAARLGGSGLRGMWCGGAAAAGCSAQQQAAGSNGLGMRAPAAAAVMWTPAAASGHCCGVAVSRHSTPAGSVMIIVHLSASHFKPKHC